MRQPVVSVVLGVKNGIRTIEGFIECIRAQTYPRIELVIVDNFSTDGTAEICRVKADKFYQQGPERSAQRNRGIQECSGEYVLALDADQRLKPGVVQECVEIVTRNREIKAVFVPEETVAEGFWGRCKVFERDFYIMGDMSAEAARFFDRQAVLAIGGYDETQCGSEDWDLSDRVLARHPQYGRTESTLIHDEGLVSLPELIRKKAYYSRGGISKLLIGEGSRARRMFFLFRPSVRKQWYRFFQHPVLGMGTILLKLLEGLTVLPGLWSRRKPAAQPILQDPQAPGTAI